MKLYRPSNATEGDAFINRWCCTCVKYRGGHCRILLNTMAYDVDELGYPKEWRRNAEHRPICTAWTDQAVYVRPVHHVRKANPEQLTLFEGGK